MTFFNDIHRSIRSAQRLANTYHRQTQRYLHTIDRVATRIHDTLDEEPWSNDVMNAAPPSASKRYPFTDTTTRRLKSILDGSTSQRWTNRADDFTTALPDTYPAVNAAYLHGYIDAQRYLNDEHPGLASTFHHALNRVTQR